MLSVAQDVLLLRASELPAKLRGWEVRPDLILKETSQPSRPVICSAMITKARTAFFERSTHSLCLAFPVSKVTSSISRSTSLFLMFNPMAFISLVGQFSGIYEAHPSVEGG